MRAAELREKPTSELEEMERNLEAEVYSLRFQLATEQLSNTAKLRATKRDLARVKTVLRQRELGLSVDPAAESGEE